MIYIAEFSIYIGHVFDVINVAADAFYRIEEVSADIDWALP